MWVPLLGLTLLLGPAFRDASGAAQGSPAPAQALKVGGVFLRVADLPRSLAFYRDTLELRPLFANEEIAAVDGGGVMILLERPQRPETAANAGLAAWTEVVFEVADVRASYAALRERGVAFATPLRVVSSEQGRDRLAAAFRDPDGHVLSITGWVAKTPAP
jgi:methylmalonyl-CoA/ethylmalonyl-CoA epimerase